MNLTLPSPFFHSCFSLICGVVIAAAWDVDNNFFLIFYLIFTEIKKEGKVREEKMPPYLKVKSSSL